MFEKIWLMGADCRTICHRRYFGFSAPASIKSHGSPQMITENAPFSAQYLSFVKSTIRKLHDFAYDFFFSNASVEAMQESRTQRDKGGQLSPIQEEYSRVKASASVAILAM
ncbi:hypothetical protein EAE96_000169 [Botrytis aclada]|nr:hypothetical protein EAE96_000169 [Botrytis aclada]